MKITLLYIIQVGSNIKVGITSNSIYERMKAIQTGCPYPIDEVFYVVLSTRAEALAYESEIHTLFKKYKTSGEWFESVPRFTTKIEKTVNKKMSKIRVQDYEYSELDKKINKERKELKKTNSNLYKMEKAYKRIQNNPLLKNINPGKLLKFCGEEI